MNNLRTVLAVTAITIGVAVPAAVDASGTEVRSGYKICLPWQDVTLRAHTYGYGSMSLGVLSTGIAPDEGWGDSGGMTGSWWHTDALYSTRSATSWRVESPDIDWVRVTCD